jgi:hypothetical protein
MKQFNFENTELTVDWISLKLPTTFDQNKIADYLFRHGFNSLEQSGRLVNPKSEVLLSSEENNFQVIFTHNAPYWSGTILNFSGPNAKYFYSLIEQKSIDWEILNNPVLSRFDVYYSLKLRNSKETVEQFFKNCYEKLQLNSTTLEKNKKGNIFRIGNRRSNRYSRIYQNNQFLRFEHEMKGQFILSFSELLMTHDLIAFEYQISQNFLLYFSDKLPLDSVFTQWLIVKIRPFRKTYLSFSNLKTDYIALERITPPKDEKDLILFLQFLDFIKDCDFTYDYLGNTSYRVVCFKINAFLNYQHPNQKISYYKLNQLKNFITNLQTNFLLTKFSDQYFQSLVSVPKVDIFKSNSEWVAKVWIVDELFYYNYPFLIPNLFNTKLKKYELLTLAKLVIFFSSTTIEKRFDVKSFLLENNLSNTDRKKVKEYFIKYINIFYQNGLIENKFYTIHNGILQPTSSLTTENISEGFVIYEKLNLF